jgi:hypothetical protein
MSSDPQSPQYDSPGPAFGGPTAGYAYSGAAGTQGVVDSPAGVGGGAVIGEGRVSAPFGSSQLAANIGEVPVTQGDTSGFSDDLPAHSSAIVQAPQEQLFSTGAGQGHANHFEHPNNMNREA